MSDLIQSSFDYAALSIDAAITARAAAERIKLRLKRTVEDIIEIGRELTEVKEKLGHGHFLPWIAAEFEMTKDTAQNFMSVFDRFGKNGNFPFLNFKPSILYALAAPSTPDAVVEKAIEKAESGDNVTVADVKYWKAELDSEKQRSQEWKDQWKAERDKAIQLKTELNLAKSVKPDKIEVIPEDYKIAKDQVEKLEIELERIKKEQSQLVNDQVKAKLRGYQDELNEVEKKKTAIEEIVDRKKAYLDSLSSEIKRIETHRSVIDGSRLELIGLAAFLNDIEPINDKDTINRWLALADMHMEAANSIRLVFGETKPRSLYDV